MRQNNTINAFFALLRAGLWEKDVCLAEYGKINFEEIFRLAEQQSVTGLIAAGVDHVVDVKLPQDVVLSFVGQALQLEQRNIAMNTFVSCVVKKLLQEGIDSVLIKGQGIAQCYERPLWRVSGDVDLLMEDINYQKGKNLLNDVYNPPTEEDLYSKEFLANINGWCLELHGTIRGGLSRRIDKELDIIQKEILNNKKIRQWDNNGVPVYLPDVNNDILLIFTHFLKHYYKGGIGVRQICDWCRLIWTHKDEIDVIFLKKKLCIMRLTSEWKAFAAFAVDYLGMPSDVIPFYSVAKKWKIKAKRIKTYVMDVGNFGINRASINFLEKTYLVRKYISLLNRCYDLIKHVQVFPINTLRFTPFIIYNGIRSAFRGE